jgi:hypothetical protein
MNTNQPKLNQQMIHGALMILPIMLMTFFMEGIFQMVLVGLMVLTIVPYIGYFLVPNWRPAIERLFGVKGSDEVNDLRSSSQKIRWVEMGNLFAGTLMLSSNKYLIVLGLTLVLTILLFQLGKFADKN